MSLNQVAKLLCSVVGHRFQLIRDPFSRIGAKFLVCERCGCHNWQS